MKTLEIFKIWRECESESYKQQKTIRMWVCFGDDGMRVDPVDSQTGEGRAPLHSIYLGSRILARTIDGG
jgi:hypothetical protein